MYFPEANVNINMVKQEKKNVHKYETRVFKNNVMNSSDSSANQIPVLNDEIILKKSRSKKKEIDHQRYFAFPDTDPNQLVQI